MAALSNPLQGLRYVVAGEDGDFNIVVSSLSPTPSTSPTLHYFLYATVLFPMVFLAYRFILNDYNAFLSLGPGGTPSNFAGYLKVTALRLIFALRDPYTPPPLTPYECPATGYLQRLPHRDGPRPTVAGIAPQRQLTQKGSVEMQAALTNALLHLAAANPTVLRTGVACFEKHNLALFVCPRPGRLPPPATGSPVPPAALNPTCGSPPEITHLHTTDSSMHLTLHPSDAAVVIANGWGERHPLAGQGLFGRGWVPRGFVMVYAPRTEADIPILMSIVRAAGWWVGGEKLEGK
ncbi:hypothetical protein MMC24_002123 [Lignoscripta atroalba]|nr:hypothetical protein [Lignoscripta atroalba]